MSNIGIYKITSPSGHIYIGQSMNIKLRFAHYKRLHKIKGQQRIYNSLVKYGVENHSFEVIHELPKDVSAEVLSTYEQLYMDQYRECGLKMMNLRDAGVHGKYSEESKKKMSVAQTGKKLSSETIAKRVAAFKSTIETHGHGLKGFKQPKKSIEKRKDSRSGYRHSEETKLKIGNSNSGPTGKPLSNETKQKLREINIGKKLSEDHKRKISESNKKVVKNPLSEETKMKISISNTGKTFSADAVRKSAEKRTGQKRTLEMRQKMREGQLKYRQKLKDAIQE